MAEPGKKTTVAILAGGTSMEHEISLLSAYNVAAGLRRACYDVQRIGIDKAGRWRLFPDDGWIIHPDDASAVRLADGGAPVAFVPGDRRIFFLDRHWGPEIDVVFPVLHGPGGEDGTVQGLLRLSGLPFVGADVLGSAVGMHKTVAKRIWREQGLPVGPYVSVRKGGEPLDAAFLHRLVSGLRLPFYVKPARLGSSVGISRVEQFSALSSALSEAFRFDDEVLVEEGIDGREIECAVLGNESPIAAEPGEIFPTHAFYSYEAKYLDPNGASLQVPADLPEPKAAEVKHLACRAFLALGCEGMARVDFFLRRRDSALFINEINTIPGFTAISMYPRMWAHQGMALSDLLDRLIALALERHPLRR